MIRVGLDFVPVLCAKIIPRHGKGWYTRGHIAMPPAARLGDMDTCPMVTGLVPHVGGPVIPPCEPTVIIGGMPAARVTDHAVCVGPPDTIVKGSPTVFIGSKPAARIGDMTVHGGVIVMGCPTVIIGEAGMGGLGTAFAASMVLASKIVCAFT